MSVGGLQLKIVQAKNVPTYTDRPLPHVVAVKSTVTAQCQSVRRF